MSKEKDKFVRDEILTVLEWLQWEIELSEMFFSNKITAENVYNRYLDEMKK